MFQSLIGRLLSWPIIQSLIRHGLTSGGAIIVAHSLADQADVNTAIGAAMILIGFGHSVIQKWQLTQPTSSPGKSAPVVLALIATGALFSTGCQSTGPQQTTYQAAGTTIVSVDAAMTEWGTYVATAHPGTNAELAVESAYEKYQSAMAVACDAGAAYSATGGTNGIAALDTAIQNSSQELTDLETLIASFGVKLQ